MNIRERRDSVCKRQPSEEGVEGKPKARVQVRSCKGSGGIEARICEKRFKGS